MISTIPIVVVLSKRRGGTGGGQGVDPDGIARLAEDSPVQGVTSAPFRLRGEEEVAVLALVAIHVEAPVQGYDADRLLLARFREDRILANGAARSEFPA